MIRVGLIGCGKMADQHAYQINRIKEAKIIAVCDNEILMAKQMAERFNIKKHYENVNEMLNNEKFDVLHITTPAQSHYELGLLCLAANNNVYIEKPFTLDTTEAIDLIQIGSKKGLKITAGHNAQFSHVMIRMRELIKNGFLGGKPMHLESHYCYNLGDKNYAKALLMDKNHWVRKLPGTLLQNIISHGISKIAEFFEDDDPDVFAQGFTSHYLRNMGAEDIIDEVRVIIKDRDNTTAYFTFSTQIRPVPHQFRIYGPKNSLLVDEDHQVLIKIKNKEYKSFLKYFIPPLDYSRQYINNFGKNFRKFLNRDFHLPNDAGLKYLIELFYKSVNSNSPVPIPYKEILLTSKLMDKIFMQVNGNKSNLK